MYCTASYSCSTYPVQYKLNNIYTENFNTMTYGKIHQKEIVKSTEDKLTGMRTSVSTFFDSCNCFNCDCCSSDNKSLLSCNAAVNNVNSFNMLFHQIVYNDKEMNQHSVCVCSSVQTSYLCSPVTSFFHTKRTFLGGGRVA